MIVDKLISYFLIFLACSLPFTTANDDFFLRSAKWAKLAPSGGSLVSGRGNFRPGFADRAWRSALYEPSFSLKKRSDPMMRINPSLYEPVLL